MEYNDKIVDFLSYCVKCKYKSLEEENEPCNECIANTTNANSKKPVNYTSE